MKKSLENQMLLSNMNSRSYTRSEETNGQMELTQPKHLSSEILLTWNDVSASCIPLANRKFSSCFKKNTIQPEKQILFNVNGLAKPGEFLAIMGASGAGKTTLLNVLTLRKQRELTVTGQVHINNQPATSKEVAAISAYIHQDDLFIGTLTVKEQLIFQATLKMSAHSSYSQMLHRVDEIIQELALYNCQDTLIGIVGRIKGISGGEKQRLAIASEMITNPSVMFCDEPTSGLDSPMAQHVVTLLQNMAKKGMTVITTIHQPSSEVYAMFDKVLFLAQGRVAYLGSKENALDFFNNLNFNSPLNYNPADYFCHLLSVTLEEAVENQCTISKICDAFEKSDSYKSIKCEITSNINNNDSQFSNQTPPTHLYKTSWIRQFRTILWRSCKIVYRDPALVKMRLMQVVLISLLLGFCYYRQNSNLQSSINNINAAIFYMIVIGCFHNMSTISHIVCSEMHIFLREHASGIYSTTAYFFGKTLAELPLFVLIPLLSSTITYWPIGFYPDFTAFLIACFIHILVNNAAVSFAYMISSISSSTPMALSFTSFCMTPMVLFGGFFLRKRSVPWYFIIFQRISWFTYGFETLAINQWKDIKYIECDVYNVTCLKDGLEVLKSYDITVDAFIPGIILLLVLVVAFRLLALLAYLIRASKQI